MAAPEKPKRQRQGNPGGRPRLNPDAKSLTFGVRLESPEQRDKLKRLGGSEWIRRMLDREP